MEVVVPLDWAPGVEVPINVLPGGDTITVVIRDQDGDAIEFFWDGPSDFPIQHQDVEESETLTQSTLTVPPNSLFEGDLISVIVVEFAEDADGLEIEFRVEAP